MLIQQSILAPPVPSDDWYTCWEGPDQGLICSWLRGIEKSREDPGLAAKAAAGELPVLAWKGGVDKRIKRTDKVGALKYLATWQGLRGEDLRLETDVEIRMTCTRTGVPVLFTADITKLLQPQDGDEQAPPA